MIQRTLAIAALFVLAAPASAEECFIKRAEATVCPAYQVIEGSTDLAVSGDGRTVVGSARVVLDVERSVPARWVDGVPELLPGFPNTQGFATAVDADASVIVGVATPLPGFDAFTFRWIEGDVELLNGGPGVFPFAFQPWAINADGGTFIAESFLRGVRWAEEERVFERWEIDIPNAFPSGLPRGISGDGGLIVGLSWDTIVAQPLAWLGDETLRLPTPPNFSGRGFQTGAADAVSPDGGVIVGTVDRCTPRCEAVGAVWRDFEFEPRDFPLTHVSWEGVFMVATRDGGSLVHDPSGVVRSIESILRDLGVAPTRAFFRAQGMSNDGHVIVGRTSPFTPTQYRAVIAPKLGIDVEPGSRSNAIDLSKRRKITVRVYGSEQADASQIDPFDLRFGPGRAVPVAAKAPRDRNGDGWLDRDYRFDPADVELALGDREACLSGVANGLPFRVCSEVRTHFGVRSEGDGRWR